MVEFSHDSTHPKTSFTYGHMGSDIRGSSPFENECGERGGVLELSE